MISRFKFQAPAANIVGLKSDLATDGEPLTISGILHLCSPVINQYLYAEMIRIYARENFKFNFSGCVTFVCR